MAVIIEESTATMSAEYVGARPAVTYAKRRGIDMAVLHQRRNSDHIISEPIGSAEETSAIHMTASVSVLADDVAQIKRQYEFHLLQLAWKPIDYALYAGAAAADGSLKFDFAARNSGTIFLDATESGDPPFPYVDSINSPAFRSGGAPRKWLVSLTTDDHPYTDLPLVFPNFATHDQPNYLYQAER